MVFAGMLDKDAIEIRDLRVFLLFHVNVFIICIYFVCVLGGMDPFRGFGNPHSANSCNHT